MYPQRCVIATRLDLHHPHAVFVPDETQRRTRSVHADLNLRADGHPLDKSAQQVRNEAVSLVPTVEAHLVPKQAGRDAQSNRTILSGPHFAHSRASLSRALR
jgi:hypothetical protein